MTFFFLFQKTRKFPFFLNLNNKIIKKKKKVKQTQKKITMNSNNNNTSNENAKLHQYCMLLFKSYFKLRTKLYFMDNELSVLNDAIFHGLSLIDNIFWLEFHRSNQNEAVKYLTLDPLDQCLSRYIEFLTNPQQKISIYTAYLLSIKTHVFREKNSESTSIFNSVLRENMKNLCLLLNIYYLPKVHCRHEPFSTGSNHQFTDLFDYKDDNNLPETIEAFLHKKKHETTKQLEVHQKQQEEQNAHNAQNAQQTYHYEHAYTSEIISKIFLHFFDDHCLTLKARKFNIQIIQILIKIVNNFPEIASDLIIVLLHFFLSRKFYDIRDFQKDNNNKNYMFSREYEKMVVKFVVVKLCRAILTFDNPPNKTNLQYTELFINWVKNSKEKLDKVCYF